MALPEPAALAAILGTAYAGLTTVVADLDDTDLLVPTGCRGWLAADLLLHVTGDAQRALVALATPADGPADVDFVTYWHAFPGPTDNTAAAARTQWVRRTAAAFELPTGVVRLWRDTAPAAARAATAAVRSTAALLRPVQVAVFTEPLAAFDPFDPAPPGVAAVGHVATQGQVIALPDLIATLITEAAIHHLDLIRHLPGAPAPASDAVGVALSTVEGLAPTGELPPHWDPLEALLKSTGRAPLDDADRRALGEKAAAFPLLG
jgi:hypothetical protein